MGAVSAKNSSIHLLYFQLVNSEAIAEGSWKFSELEWLRIYNAAVKRGGMMHQNYYLSDGAMMAMVGMNDDAQASSSKYLSCKRNLRPGLGGGIVENPLVQKESDELAGKFRSSKTYLLTELRYKCTSNQGGLTNIQYMDWMNWATSWSSSTSTALTVIRSPRSSLQPSNI